MEAPPVDFNHYKNWVANTPEGRLWWLSAVSEHHVRYVCDDCGDIVWYTKGEALPETFRCGKNCYGVMRQSVPMELRAFEFWRNDPLPPEEEDQMSAARRAGG